ncbi:GAF domain-containing protein [Eilatimonas milleporae]|uniref:DNA-binding protein Fis /transcriptional regulator n=1 Tax=Eilatimonas milleporae TaxID=911205 RepID=A0A3M0CHT5_9PROT|nr:GAF domain-containing protein [Eilatimonas milleporae]RMB08070.1 DNA-binding protein Fis /transcriptional regulator [Eilatimonas milleporae]
MKSRHPVDRAAGAVHAERVLHAARSASAAATSSVAASWSRSLNFHGLAPDDPLRQERMDAARFREACERMDRLLPIAAGVMDRLFAAVGDTGCSVVFSDADGVILDRRGAPGDDDTFAECGLWTGTTWSERTEGTNGIGTCLIEERPVIVYRDDHFHSRNTAMSCMGAPVFDHLGRLAAVLDISSCRDDLTKGVARLTAHAVADAARRIESDNFQAAFPGCRIVVAEGHGPGGAMLLAVDRDDLLVGATRKARKTLGLDDDSFRTPSPLGDVMDGAGRKSDLGDAERGEIRRALARAGGNASAAARDLGVSRATLYRHMARLGVSR